MKDSDERYNKSLSVYKEETQDTVIDTDNILVEEVKKYENYREYPVIVNIKDKVPNVSLDISFIRICHDFGRFLAFNDVDSDEAMKEAKDFSDKLVKPIQGIIYSDGSNEYNRDTIARTFGMIFINNGFFHSNDNLSPEKITELTNYTVIVLEDNGYIR